MKRLFAILQTNLQQSISREQEILDAIKVMCDAGIGLSGKILDTAERLQYDSPAIYNEAQNHMKKLQTLKRQYYEVDKPEKKKDDDMSNGEERFKNTIAFVDDYKMKLDKKSKKGKATMSWVGCHAKLKNEANVIQYKISEVLRVQYTKHKRSKAVKWITYPYPVPLNSKQLYITQNPRSKRILIIPLAQLIYFHSCMLDHVVGCRKAFNVVYFNQW